MIKKRVLPFLLMAMVFFSGTCLAENMQFVDANGATGYYVDVDSIEFSTDKVWIQPDPIPAKEPGKPSVVPKGYMAEVELVTARVAVIKARQNRRFIYRMRFNPTLSTYQILSSVTQQYDTRATLQTDNTPLTATGYTVASPMHEMVDFIYEQPRK
ncbi:hypothetical protein SAMN02910356_01533 [Selenomonas sp. GACV-9]|uniref:hypothetical protein n=1 Tax=Selenomonas sp. GACV-9 TaxID=3158782 RepID=UPI0008ED9360|nr:hypothetical protein SAMN02910356_01533 [Selenomonas ruminantium]